MKIEIFERKTGKVVETQELENLDRFMFYWAMQCNSKDFDWRRAR